MDLNVIASNIKNNIDDFSIEDIKKLFIEYADSINQSSHLCNNSHYNDEYGSSLTFRHWKEEDKNTPDDYGGSIKHFQDY